MSDLNKFGKLLHTFRARSGVTSTVLSSQLNVSPSYLSKLENGREKPSRQILNSISMHLSLKKDEAAALWIFAGYPDLRQMIIENSSLDQEGKGVSTKMDEVKSVLNANQKPLTLKVNEGLVVIYTDIAAINSNPNGVVINFGQMSGPSNEAIITTRVGMSIDHAKSLVKALEDNIKKVEAKNNLN